MNKYAMMIGISVVAAGCASMATGPQAIDWNKVPATKVALFYPGQSSYQWLRSEAHKGANKETVRGDACASCHDDPTEEATQGAKILSGKHPLEPQAAALKGKNGHVDMTVQAAYDDKNAYLRFQWKGQTMGTEHPYYRFDGKEWKKYGETVWHKSVKEGKQPALYESRFSVMLDDGKVPGFEKQGCWQTCHDGMTDMAKEATKEELAANALLKGKSDLRKFLPATRNDSMDWKSGKSVEEIAKLKEAGGYLDLFQWRGARSHPAGMADDGFVLEYRNSDAGKNMWSGNFDSKTKLPKFMWDEKKTGYKAIGADKLNKGLNYLDPTSNAVAFDPNAGWKEGDLLPSNTVSRAHAEGSAADNSSIASYKDGVWTLVLIRPLGLVNKDDKPLKAGGVYNVGFAVHDGNIDGRGHFVSYAKTLGLGVKADIQAIRLN
ncbi:MAG: ethylbenzene dehydrogenase-related protein [Rhodocyclaceae bacterium]|nr:ethylbenzene dehydrogenase-related protein [Rhodocyclaceae bacterium]